jgi:hypothetical protein
MGDPGERPGRLCAVYWLDIQASAGWSDEWEPDLEPAECVDVGWVREYPDHIVIVRSIDTTNRAVGDIAAIPRGCVVAVLPIGEPAHSSESTSPDEC